MINAATEFQFQRGVTVKNRIIMAPMTTKMSFENGEITLNEEAYYRIRSGEVGAIITVAANVQGDGKGWEGELSVASDDMIPNLNQLALAIQRQGTKAILQIFHAGRMTNSKILRGMQPLSASSIPSLRPGAELPREMKEEEIYQVITNFGKATKRAIEAGFDGVELHGANTYLLQQFFSPHSNRRRDQWGGTLENRYRFIQLLVKEVTHVVDTCANKPFLVGYRFSPEEYEAPGISFADTMYLVNQLNQAELDYLHISLKTYQQKSTAADYQEKSMLAYVHDALAGKTPLISVGGVVSSADCEAALVNSELVAAGSALLVDPHWAGKALQKQDQLIKHTITPAERRELFLGNGVWEFMIKGMPQRIR